MLTVLPLQLRRSARCKQSDPLHAKDGDFAGGLPRPRRGALALGIMPLCHGGGDGGAVGSEIP